MMKKKIRSGLQNKECTAQIMLVILLLLSSFWVFREYLFGGSLMVFNDIGSDTWQQYIQQYATVVNHLVEGNFTFWDFNNGLGTNMLSMNLFDPSLMVIYLMGVLFGTSKMVYFLSWMHVARVLLAGWVFYRYLSMFKFRIPVKVSIAFAYGFNGFLMVWGQHYQFGMVTIYFPLLLMFCEKFIRKEKGRAGFPVMVAVSCIYSVYQTYMCLIVVGFYLIFRLWMEEGLNFKERVARFIKGCLMILLGIGMGCVVFLPTAYMLLTVSGRVGSVNTDFVTWLKEHLTPYPRAYYESVIMRLFSSNIQESYGLSDGRYEKYLNYYEDPVLYVSGAAVILMIQTFFVYWRSKNSVRKKLAVYGAALCVGAVLAVPMGGTVFNAFSNISHRYTFVLVPFMLLAAAWMWEYLLEGGIPSILGLVITAYLAERVFKLGYAQTLFTSYKQNAWILAITCATAILVIGFYAVTGISKKGKNVYLCKFAMMVMMASMMLNGVSEGYTCYNERVTLQKQDTPLEKIEEIQNVYEEEFYSKDQERFVLSTTMKVQDYFREMYSEDIQDALAFIEENEDTFYRVEKDFSSGTVAMDSLTQGYFGVSTYNSTLNRNVREFMELCCRELFKVDMAHVQFWEETEDHNLAAYFGVKYLLSKNKNLNKENYELVKQFGDIYVYRNKADASIARFYETTISEESFKTLCTGKNRDKFLGKVLAVEGGISIDNLKELGEMTGDREEKSIVSVNSLETHAKVSGTIDAVTEGFVLFMIPYENGWSMEIDGKETEIIRGDLGFIACEVKEGVHEYALTFHTPMLTEGMIVSIVCLIIYFGGIYVERKKEKGIR